MRSCPNLYADISAGSGFNALTRDPDFGVRFLNEFQDRLMFGTDMCFADEEGRMPQIHFLRQLLQEGKISREAFDKMTYRNALQVMKRYRG